MSIEDTNLREELFKILTELDQGKYLDKGGVDGAIEDILPLIEQERRKAAREAIADIYTKSTTTEWPRTYETWHEQLKRVLEDKLKELENDGGRE